MKMQGILSQRQLRRITILGNKEVMHYESIWNLAHGGTRKRTGLNTTVAMTNNIPEGH